MSDIPKRWSWEEWWTITEENLSNAFNTPVCFVSKPLVPHQAFHANESYINYVELENKKLWKSRKEKVYALARAEFALEELQDAYDLQCSMNIENEDIIQRLKEALEYVVTESGLSSNYNVNARRVLKECFGGEDEKK